MAEYIGQFKITTSNGSARNNQRSSLRVYLGVEVVAMLHRDPMGSILTKIRRVPSSGERAEFLSQMRESGIPEEDIQAILTTEGKKLGRDGYTVKRRVEAKEAQ